MKTITEKLNTLKQVRDALIETGAGQQCVAANGPTILTVVQRALDKGSDEQAINTGLVMAEMAFMQFGFEPEHETRAGQIRTLIAATK